MPRATTLPKPWHYPAAKRSPAAPDITRPDVAVPDEGEGLVGEVQGKKASAPEERLARALGENDDYEGFEFRRVIIAPSGVAGSIEVDFWVYHRSGRQILIKVDGDWVHSLPENTKKDKEDYDTLVKYCSRRGLEKPRVVKGSDLSDMEMARQTLRELV